MAKVFVFGIDGAAPELIFDKWLDELPNIKSLMEKGVYSRMNSSVPPSTCVAWNSFCSGKCPSEFGVYGYTYRENFDYEKYKLISSMDVKTEMIWDILSKNNKRSIVLGVPVTYPVKSHFNGIMVTGFMTPEFNDKSVHPILFKQEIKDLLKQNYLFDVDVGLASYKNKGKNELLEKVYKMTEMHLNLINYVLENEDWDFFMNVFIGSDRLQHTMWAYHDKTHRNYSPGNEYENSLKDYYKYLDKELGKIIAKLGKDSIIIVASDHGMDKMEGRINLNDWLIKNGYLFLKGNPEERTKLKLSNIDWDKTKAYAIGAYFGRIYFNLEGREPNGIVKEEEYQKLQDGIIDGLKLIKNDKGKDMNNRFFKPQEIYKGKYLKESPDLYIYFDNLIWGVNNDVGNEGLYSWSTTLGSDDAGHSPEGIFIMAGKGVKPRGKIDNLSLVDATPIILNNLNIKENQTDGGMI